MNPPKLNGPFRDLLDDTSLSPALADRILGACTVRDIPARTYLYHIADDPRGMWGLAEGALSVEFAPGLRDPQLSFLLVPPVWLGEGGLIAGTPRSVGVSTTRRSVLLYLPAQQFFDILQDEPLIWRWIAEVQKKNFERALGMVDALMVRRSDERVAAVLVQLGGLLGHHAALPRELDITQTELAAIANVSRTVLSPVLKTLASKNAVRLGHRTITIIDATALRSFSA
jgi:CRP-like cAMP-binding protein